MPAVPGLIMGIMLRRSQKLQLLGSQKVLINNVVHQYLLHVVAGFVKGNGFDVGNRIPPYAVAALPLVGPAGTGIIAGSGEDAVAAELLLKIMEISCLVMAYM